MKYLKVVLTVIAFCLLIITFNIMGLIPSAQARNNSQHYATIPVNSDGSINVKFDKSDVLNVNLDEIGGYDQLEKTVDVNVDKVDGSSADYPLHVETDN